MTFMDKPHTCPNPKCKIDIKQEPDQYIDDFGKPTKFCLNCRIKNHESDVARRIRDRISGKNKIKEQKRLEKFQKELNELCEKYKGDPNIQICTHRDCKNRLKPVKEYPIVNGKETKHCLACRLRDLPKWAKSWAKRKQNPEFLERVNRNLRMWRANNPELNDAINQRRRTNALYHAKNIQTKAQERNISFELDINVAAEMCIQLCHYCGDPPTDDVLNGIDRVNNNLPYIETNVVTACKFCNKLKGNATVENFYKRMKHIIKFKYPDTFPEEWYYPEAFFVDTNKSRKKHAHATTYKTLLYNAKHRKGGIEVKINSDFHEKIKKLSCTYCGLKEFPNVNYINIDRVDSSEGYIESNCVPACSCCNKLKSDHTLDFFYDHIVKLILKQLQEEDIDNQDGNDFEGETNEA